MHTETRKEKLRAILRQALNEQLQSEAEATDLDSNRWRLSGPWGAFFEEHNAWDCATRLSRDLYLELSGQFDDNLIREILLAAADVKISRTSLTDAKIGQLQVAAERHGFQIATSKDQWILRADQGKGGWANRAERLAEPGEACGVRNVYIASDTTLAETGKMLDEAGEDDLFGALLGIPACCREAFERAKQLAAEKQYDFVPFVLQNTRGSMPYDWRLNYTAQYFVVGDYPDVIIACCGGGSNFGGVAFPFLADKAAGKNVRLVAVEPESCPTLTRGHYAYDSGDTAGLTPLMLMYTLGRNFVPPSIHAGGLRYHGDSPLVSQFHHEGIVEAVAVPQRATFEAGLTFARTEGIIPAPESNHAIRVAIDEALESKRTGEPKTIFFNLSGHGNFDMAAYDSYLSGKLEDSAYPAHAIEEALAELPKVDVTNA